MLLTSWRIYDTSDQIREEDEHWDKAAGMARTGDWDKAAGYGKNRGLGERTGVTADPRGIKMAEVFKLDNAKSGSTDVVTHRWSVLLTSWRI